MVQYRSQVHCSSVLSQIEQTMGPGMGRASLKTVPDRRLRRQGGRTEPFAKELQARSVSVVAALRAIRHKAVFERNVLTLVWARASIDFCLSIRNGISQLAYS